MFKLIITNLKAYRKAYQHYCILIVTTLLLCFCAIIGVYSYQEFQQNQRQELYGKYHGAIYHIQLENLKTLQHNQMIDQVNISKNYGNVMKDGVLLGQLGEYENTELMKIRMYKGRMPENKQEIVMEMSLLDQLKISYDLNQTIDLKIDHQTYSFQLVGICYNFSHLHKTDDQMMVNIITKGFDVKDRNCYFTLKDGFLDSLPDFTLYGEHFITNDYTYISLNDNQSPYFLLVFYIVIFAFIAMGSISRYMYQTRMKQLSIMYQLGLLKSQLILMLWIEKTIVFILSVISSLIIICLITLCLQFYQYPIIIPYSKLIDIILIYILLHCILSLMDTIQMNHNPVKKVKVIKRKRKPINQWRILYIFNRTYPFRFIIRCLLIASSLSICAIGFIDVYHQYQDYHFMKETYQYQYSYGDLAMPYENKNGMTLQEYQQLQGVYGVKQINSISQSPYYPISYKGDQSEYAQFIKNEVMSLYSGQQELLGSLYGISDSLFDEYQSFVQVGQITKEEFQSNHVILHLPTYYQYQDGWKTIYDAQRDKNYSKMYKEEMIHIGDQITINHQSLTISAIIYDDVESWYGNISRPYGMICNQNLYQKITDLDTYQFVSIETYDHINFEQTEAELSRIHMNDMTLTNDHHERETILLNMWTSLFVTSIILSTILIGFKIVFIYLNQSYERTMNKYYKVMNALGASQQQLNQIDRTNEIIIYLLALLISFIMVCLWIQNYYLTDIIGIEGFHLLHILKNYIFDIPIYLWIGLFIVNGLLFKTRKSSSK
ncbi:FtsX-like permease family protein [Candidatus Stoquefichus massiliensis]|uniref:FtsX-like permease family protein n=1 Tax=Candidatus Stoquefichus massiliensis TaxID=1470350 RepID=UPI0004820DF8|nr:FtsX-like permease family protein [Candidatus Stoquefichus massiliensis]